jgi:hypothetical protein
MTTADQDLRIARNQKAQKAADAAAADLKAALARVGLALPSLRSAAPVAHYGFVELGGCNATLAAELASVINAAADAAGK